MSLGFGLTYAHTCSFCDLCKMFHYHGYFQNTWRLYTNCYDALHAFLWRNKLTCTQTLAYNSKVNNIFSFWNLELNRWTLGIKFIKTDDSHVQHKYKWLYNYSHEDSYQHLAKRHTCQVGILVFILHEGQRFLLMFKHLSPCLTMLFHVPPESDSSVAIISNPNHTHSIYLM
jgi:hypothetical protein